MFKLLFSPEGRIFPQEFIKGAVVLLALNFILWLGWFVGFGIGILAAFIALVTVYCWGCLFAKRFHDADMTGWFFIFVLLAFLGLAMYIIPLLTAPLFPPNADTLAALEIVQGFQEADVKPTTPEEMRPVLDAMYTMMRNTAMPNSITYFISGAAIAFGLNKFLKSDPEPNRWG